MPYEVPNERVDELVDVISQAFGQSPDPPSEYVFECEPNALAFKQQLFRSIGEGCPEGALRQASSKNMEAISIWFPPGVVHLDDDEPDLFDPSEFRCPETPKRLEGMLRSIGVATEKLGSEPQWYLQVLATRREHQGQGHTSSLMKSVFVHADENALPCSLVCAKHNIPVYEHFGFEVLAETAFTGSGLTVFSMRREPRTTIE